MSSTNKTTNYDLSQFVSTDKPAWLTDYNQDMSKIDTAVKSASDTATGADGKADAATSNIGVLTNLTTTAKNTLVAAVNEVDGLVSTAQNTANTAAAGVTANTSSISALANMFNLNNHLQYGFSDMTIVEGSGTLPTGADPVLYIDRNSDGTVFKIYGTAFVTPSSSTVKVRIPTTGITTDTSYTINGAGITFPSNGTSNGAIRNLSFDVNNNSIDLIFSNMNTADGLHVARIFACLYFNSDFGNVLPSE